MRSSIISFFILYLLRIPYIYSIKILKTSNNSGCPYRTNYGDIVELKLSADVKDGEKYFNEKLIEQYKSAKNEYTIQKVTVGKHSVKPLNKALVGLCEKATRSVAVPLMNAEIIYSFQILKIESPNKKKKKIARKKEKYKNFDEL